MVYTTLSRIIMGLVKVPAATTFVQRTANAFNQKRSIHRPFQELIDVSGFVRSCKKIVKLPQIDVSIIGPAERIVSVVIPTNTRDLLVSEKVGRVTGILEGLPEETQQNVIIDIILAEAIKISEIEGEYPSGKDVFSSIRKNLGLHHSPENINDKSAAGLGELMIDVRKTFKESLTEEKLFAWHKMLLRENKRIKVGQWRTHKEPMEIISGAIAKEKVHYEAPPSSIVGKKRERFIQWFNDTAPSGKNEIKKAPRNWRVYFSS